MTDSPKTLLPTTVLHAGQLIVTQHNSPEDRRKSPKLLQELRLRNLGPSHALLLKVCVQWPKTIAHEFTLALEEILTPGEETTLISRVRRQALMDAMDSGLVSSFSPLNQDMVFTVDVLTGQAAHQLVLHGGWAELNRFQLWGARQQSGETAASQGSSRGGCTGCPGVL